MRLLSVLLVAFLMFVGIRSHGQRITLKKKNISLQHVFKEIRKQTKYDFLYNTELLKGINPVNVNFKNSKLEKALDSLLHNKSLEYTITDKVVMITAKETFIQLKPMVYSISGVV
jgi:hypothetical protein